MTAIIPAEAPDQPEIRAPLAAADARYAATYPSTITGVSLRRGRMRFRERGRPHPRAAGSEKSMVGPSGTMPLGLTRRWLP